MSDDVDKLNEAVRSLNQTVNDLSTNLGIFAEVTVRASRGTKANDEETNKLLNSLGGYRRNVDGLTEAEKSRIEAQRKGDESLAHFKSATENAKKAIGDFAGAMLNTNVKLTNMGTALSGAGDAAFELGKAISPLGAIIGGIVKGFTMLAEASLKQTESLLENKDQLTKMGGAGAHTTESIRKMAREADLNSETLGRMIKPIQGMGSSIMVLGSTAGEAQKEFAQLIKATDEERKQMMRLGINQEEMMQGTADYLALQSMSGRSIKNELQDREKLRRASLDYQTNLLDLAALTGKDVATLKEKQKEMMLDRQVQLKNMQDDIKVQRLREAANQETDETRKKALLSEADALEKETKARNDGLKALAGAPDALRKGMQELTTGTISGKNAQTLSLLGMQEAVAEYNKTIKEGGDAEMAAAKLQDEYVKRFGERVETTGRQMAISGEVAQRFGGDQVKDLELLAQRRGKSYAEDLAAQRERNKAAQKAGQDTGADVRATMQEGVIKTTGALDDVIAATNPLIGEFTLLKGATVAMTAAAGAATLALGAFALKGKAGELLGGAKAGGAAGGSMLETLKGLLGNRGSAAAGSAAVPAGPAGAQGAAGIVQGLGQGGGNMLEGAAKGLAAFANPKVALGAAGLGTAIAAVGAGIAGATWIMGKALPSLAEGLGSFEKIDGDKLAKTGKGILALGGGLAVFGAGGAAAGFGAIASSISDGLLSFFGGKTPFQKIEEFSKLDIDADKVKSNAEAFSAFSTAMAKAGGGSAAAGIGSAVGALGDAITGLFKGKSSFDKLKEFAKIDLGEGAAKKVKENAQAFVYFSKAMSEYKGTAGDGLGSAINKSISEFFNVEPPVEQMQKFAAINLGEDGAKKLKANAEAFGIFADAMGKYKGEATDGGLIAGINKATNSFFEIDPPTQKMVKFSQIDIGEGGAKKVKENAQAFVYFSKAMAEYKGDATDSISGMLASSAASFFNAEPPTAKLVKFSELKINPESVKKNSEAFVLFSNAMASYKGGSAIKNAADNIVGGISKFFGGDSVVDKFVKFTKIDVDPERASKLADAFSKYSTSVATLSSPGKIPAIPESRPGPIISGGASAGGGSSGGGGTMPAVSGGTGAPVKAGGGGGGGMSASIASALPSGTGSQGSKEPAGPKPNIASVAGGGDAGGGSDPDKKGPPGGKFKDKEEFVKVMMPWAEYASKQLGAPALGILGQWAGESGAGKNLPADYNYAGIKAGKKFAKGDYVLTEERYNQKQLERAIKSGESLAGVIDSPTDTIRKKGRDVTIDQWYGAGAFDKAAQAGLNWVQVKSHFAKFNDLKDFTDSYIGFLKNPRYADALKAESAEDFGYAVAKAGYATASADKYASKVGDFAKSISAREGGIVNGPISGYAATLHGNEVIVPLNPNSILAELGKKTTNQVQTETIEKTSKLEGMNPEVFGELVNINKAMMDMMSAKLDSMIDKLDTSNNTQDKLLKYSQA